MPSTPPLPARNGPYGFGRVARVLHWSIAVAIAVQLVVGYLMDGDESGHGRGRGRGGGSGHGRGRGGGYDPFGDDRLLTLHVVLGATILALATVRLVWRLTTPLPPWAPSLSSAERTIVHWTERALYVLMFAIPLSGLWLVLADDDDLLGAHVATHLAFFVVIALHIGTAAKHQLVDRDQLLRRMLGRPNRGSACGDGTPDAERRRRRRRITARSRANRSAEVRGPLRRADGGRTRPHARTLGPEPPWRRGGRRVRPGR
jgi:cytochrome b561